MNQYIQQQNKRLLSVRQRMIPAIALMLVSALLLSTASYAWITLAQAPELSGVTTNVGANGNLEIALGKNIGESAVGDSFDEAEVTQANRTWGNLLDLTDASYGLQEITLRPAMLNTAGGAVNTLHPLAHPVYGKDGRIEEIYANDMFAGTFNGLWFTTAANDYGVHGIGTTMYRTPGNEGTFGPLSQRQEDYYRALNDLSQMMESSYKELCQKSQSVLMAYCNDGTGISATDFNLNAFSQNVDAVVSAANEELRLCFTLFAAAEMTSSENYLTAMDLLEEKFPDYGEVRLLVDEAIQATEAVSVGAAIEELHKFRSAANQLKKVITSGEIDSSDGYSREEIEKTVGLVFNLEDTRFVSFSVDDESFGVISHIDNYFYSKVISGLFYQVENKETGYWYDYTDRYEGSSVHNLTASLYYDKGYQDNDSREGIANDIIDLHMYPITRSLPLADLNQTIADLYTSHWNYWDEHAKEYQQLQKNVPELETQVMLLKESITELQGQTDADPNDISALEAELQLKTAELAEKKAQLQTLLEEKVYVSDDSRLETIRSVIEDTIEAMRKYTLWSIAYYACDGRVPDDAYRRMQEIANSPAYMHPRTAYRALCNYGVTPADSLAQMVAAFEKLERELLFLSGERENAESIMWSELSAELQRIFGTIILNFRFYIVERDGDDHSSYAYNSSYAPEPVSAPIEVMTEIRKEIKEYENAEYNKDAFWYRGATYSISYGSYEESQFWSQALGLLQSFYHYSPYADRTSPFDYGESKYTLEKLQFSVNHSMPQTGGFPFDITIGVGSEGNFNESGLTVRQTRFQKAQESISGYQSQLIAAAVNPGKEMTTLLTQMMAGQGSVSLAVISDYLKGLQTQVEYAEEMMYQAALAMAASDYAEDEVYQFVYSDRAPKDAAGLIERLRQSDFDPKVMRAFTHRMDLLDDQKSLLNRSFTLLKNYQDPETGALIAEQIPVAEAAALLNPVLDTGSLTLYGYVEEKQEEKPGQTVLPSYVRTVLYTGYGSAAVKINGKQVTVGDAEPVTIFGDVYLSVGRSLSGALLALAKTQVESYTPPAGSLKADEILKAEMGMNRQSYAIGTGESMYTLNLRTADAPYALATNLWTYTGNTRYISANNMLMELYGYSIDLSLRTNVADSDLMLQTDAIDRIYNGEEVVTDTTMGEGSYMEFTILHPSYTLTMAREYMDCLRVVFTDTNTGYIYGYGSLDMGAAEAVGLKIKAPLRLYDKDTGVMLAGDSAQYLCHLDQNLEKNLTVYVYLDGAKTTDAMVSAYDEQSLNGVLNLQFCSSADLDPAFSGVSISTPKATDPGMNEEAEVTTEPIKN